MTSKQEAINAPWCVYFVVPHSDEHIRVGMFVLFLVRGFARTQKRRISQ